MGIKKSKALATEVTEFLDTSLRGAQRKPVGYGSGVLKFSVLSVARV
jgi:hypothetical protein